MKVPAKLKIEKLCSRDATRPVLCMLFLRIVGEGDDRRGFLEGTDSYKLGRVPVDLHDDDTEGFVSVDAIVTARKLKTDTIVCNGSLAIGDPAAPVVHFPRTFEGQFPNTDQLLDVEPARIEGQTFRIGLNARLLLELAQGIGSEIVTLEFAAVKAAPGPDGGAPDFRPSNLRPITVRPGNGSRQNPVVADAIGLLMPVRV